MALKDFLNRPGPGVIRDAPRKSGLRLFFEVLWREFWELIKLNLLFLVFCLPILTIPAAITAMNRIVITMVQDKNHFLFRDFIAVFKREFLRSLIAGLLIGFGLAATVFGAIFYSNILTSYWLIILSSAAAIAGFVIVFVMGFYVFAQLALLELGLKQIFKNAFSLLFVCLKPNGLALLIAGVLLVLGIGMLPYSMPAFVMILFSLTCLIEVCLIYPGVEKYLIKSNSSF